MMPAAPNKRMLILSLICCLSAGVMATPPQCVAAAEALGVKLHTGEAGLRCVIPLDNRPAYTLAHTGGGISLVLEETSPAEKFLREARALEDRLTVREEPQAGGLEILFPIPSGPSKASAYWLEDRPGIYVKVSWEDSKTKAESPGEAISLERAHFGVKGTRTRMALHLVNQPSWRITQSADKSLYLKLLSVAPVIRDKKFGPAGDLESADIRREGEDTGISLKTNSFIHGIGLEWKDDAEMLVADVFGDEDPPAAPTSPVAESLSGASRAGTVAGTGPEAGPEKEANSALVQASGPMVRGRILGTPNAQGGGKGPEPAGDRHGERPAESEEELLKSAGPEEAVLYGEILQAHKEGEHKQAAALCRKFMERFPASVLTERISYLEGDSEYALVMAGETDRHSSMMRAYQRAIAIDRKSPRTAEAYLNMGRAASAVGNNYAALGYLNIALNSPGESELKVRAHLERGRIYLAVNRPEKAIEDFKAVMSNFPETRFIPEARLGIARYHLAMGLYEKAEQLMKELVLDHPRFPLEHPELLFFRARNLIYLERYEEARETLFRALNMGGQPETPDLLLARIGDTFHHEGRLREAEDIYEAVTQEYPESEGAAIAKLRLAGYDSDQEGFREIHAENPGRPIADLALLEMGRKSFEKGDFLQAMETLKTLVEQPVQGEIHEEAERLYYRAAEQEITRLHKEGNPGELARFYEAHQAGLQGNVDPEVLLLAGLSLYELERYQEALSVMERIRPFDLSRVSKGKRALAMVRAYLATGRQKEALAILEDQEAASRLTASDTQELRLILAGLYQETGRSRQALEIYEDLVDGRLLLPDREIAKIHLEMGRIANKAGEPDQARASINRCIGLASRDPKNRVILRQAYAELGDSYFRETRYAKALEAYELALEAGYGPGEEGYWGMRFRMAQSYLEVGDYESAEPLLVEVSEEADPLLQQRVLIRLGMIELERQLRRLPVGRAEP